MMTAGGWADIRLRAEIHSWETRKKTESGPDRRGDMPVAKPYRSMLNCGTVQYPGNLFSGWADWLHCCKTARPVSVGNKEDPVDTSVLGAREHGSRS